jgi:hypothetical protein
MDINKQRELSDIVRDALNGRHSDVIAANKAMSELLNELDRLAMNWDDLAERLEKADVNLISVAHEVTSSGESDRLIAKASGIALARDYMRGY